MSDLEKVYAYANGLLGPNTPIQLRWEGAGDSTHAAQLLSSLQSRTYGGGTQTIKYHAVINLYEPEDSEIFTKAQELMAEAHATAGTHQTYEMRGGADVKRDARVFGQNQAHIMFIRNIMLTNEEGESLTHKKYPLRDLHGKALRKRANSLVAGGGVGAPGGQIRLGMSGAPGLQVHTNRGNTPVRQLFFGFHKLGTEAGKGGLSLVGSPGRKGKADSDTTEIMKNDGSSLGPKPTYYLTYQR